MRGGGPKPIPYCNMGGVSQPEMVKDHTFFLNLPLLICYIVTEKLEQTGFPYQFLD